MMGKEEELLAEARSGNVVQVVKLLERLKKRSIHPFSSFRRSPNINSQDMNGYTALHHACLNGHVEIVRLLLEYGAIPDIRDIRGSTPLYLASWAGRNDLVKILLEQKYKSINVNVQTVDNETPLHCAAQHGHSAVLETLLAQGADPLIRNDSFQTPLDLAAQFGRLQVVQILINNHPDLLDPYRLKNRSNEDLHNEDTTKLIFTHTCLHLASRNGHKQVVEALLAAGIDVNVMTHAGTALHEAAMCGKTYVVETLLQAGVNIHALDGHGNTALELLKDYPPHEIVTIIKDYCDENGNARYFRPIRSETISSNKYVEHINYEEEKNRNLASELNGNFKNMGIKT